MQVFMVSKQKRGTADVTLLLKGGKVLPKGEFPRLQDCYKTRARAEAVVERLNVRNEVERGEFSYYVSEWNYS